MPTIKKAILFILLMAAVYVVSATMRYRFNNPELTETQLTLMFFEALLWK